MTQQGIMAIRECINTAQNTPYIPDGYIIENNTLYKIMSNKEKNIPICDPLYIKAAVRDNNGNNWGRLLVWHNQDGKQHKWTMPSLMLAGDGIDYRKILLSQGLNIRAGRNAHYALHDYIMAANPRERAISVSMPGWNKNCYVCPDGTVYGENEEQVLLQITGSLPQLENKGTLQNWQNEVAYYAPGNSRLLFSISAALAGPLLSLANESSGGFHFAGGSSTGKTTALRVSSSVWGLPLRSWRTTDNAAESWARLANDGFLPIDELGQVDGRAADHMAYMLGNGQTKGRSNRDGIARETPEFRLLFMSTGEVGLAEKLPEGNKKAQAGQMVRMLEIPADAGAGYGLFENLHGFKSADELAKHLAHATLSNKGQPINYFLDYLTKFKSEELQHIISVQIDKWMSDHVPLGADGQVLRAARRFALVAVAGEIAASINILPWQDGEASKGAARCFQDWLITRGGSGSHEVQEGLKEIVSFINRFGSSRFIDLATPYEKCIDRAGFRRFLGDEKWEYLFFPNVLKDEVLGGSKNAQTIIQAAKELGLIAADCEGKTSKPVNLPGLGKKRMICVHPARITEV